MGITILVVAVALLIAAAVYAVLIYNNLVQLKHSVGKSWSNIDVLLKQRHDELPKLVDTCKQYMSYERETLERVMQARDHVSQARASGDVQALGQAESRLRTGLGQLFAVAEAYPDLKADEAFQRLQARITSLENAIADRREFYNESANRLNVRIDQFPDTLLAQRYDFKPVHLLEFDRGELTDVDVGALFS